MRIGFLGMGIMGSAMAENLIKGGFDVTVWNRTPEKCGPLVELGAAQASSPKVVVDMCDLTFAMLADPTVAKDVCFGPDGVIEAIGPGKGYVDCSTVDAETSSEIGAAVTANGGRFLEAPVSGSKKPAHDAQLVFLAAGDRSLFDETIPAFDKMGKKAFYLGETGSGANMKLIHNMILGGMMTIFAEGLAMAGKTGLSNSDLLEVLDLSIMANSLFRLKGELVGKANYSPAFPLKHMQKDMRLVVQLGDSMNQPLFSASAAGELYKKAKSMGFFDEDFSAVYEAIK